MVYSLYKYIYILVNYKKAYIGDLNIDLAYLGIKPSSNS